MSFSMHGAVEEVDAAMDKINKLVRRAAAQDPDIVIIADVIHGAQRAVDVACATAQEVDDIARRAAR